MDAESGRSESTLEMYKLALELRREVFSTEKLEWVDAAKGCVGWKRDGVRVLVNFTGEDVQVPDGKILVASGAFNGGQVPEWTTVWIAE